MFRYPKTHFAILCLFVSFLFNGCGAAGNPDKPIQKKSGWSTVYSQDGEDLGRSGLYKILKEGPETASLANTGLIFDVSAITLGLTSVTFLTLYYLEGGIEEFQLTTNLYAFVGTLIGWAVLSSISDGYWNEAVDRHNGKLKTTSGLDSLDWYLTYSGEDQDTVMGGFYFSF